MALDPLLKAQLKQVLTIETASTVNSYGEIQVGSAATCFCRMEELTQWKEKLDGTFERTKTLLIIDTDAATPNYGSLLWLPGTVPTTAAFAARPSQIVPCIDENGSLDHWEIYV